MTDYPTSLLPDRGRCTGCGACAAAPKGPSICCPDREGFLYPTVTDACIQCGHCAHICPVLKQREPRPEPAVSPPGTPTPPCARPSPAGGVFPLAGGVYPGRGRRGVRRGPGPGAAGAAHRRKGQGGAAPAPGGQAVQSDLGDSFRRVRHYLDQGRRVLFSGTPCQVDGLYHFLGEHPERLLTCDVVCSGVSSPGVWGQLVRSMAYIKRQPPVDVCFCGKLPGEKDRRFRVRFAGGSPV